MRLLLVPLSIVLILICLLDGFEAIVLTRRVTHRFRFARFFYRTSWLVWRSAALRIQNTRRRLAMFSLFGPLTLLALIGLWALGLILGFAVLQWSLESPLHTPDGSHSFGTYFYFSGITFFTLGYGDVTPSGWLGRMLAVIEAGTGFGFLAVIISYIPVLTQVSSKREIIISLLDARAGSPPTAAQALVRLGRTCGPGAFESALAEWERWCAELLEAHLSYPSLSFYRSQHDNQSWLATVTTIMDVCALLIVAVKECDSYQSQLTFAMARHAVVDIALVHKLPAPQPKIDRLPPEAFTRLRQTLAEAGIEMNDDVEARLAEMRLMYEPFVTALAELLLFPLPAFISDDVVVDNWQRSAWTPRPRGIGQLPGGGTDEHF